MPEQRNHRVVEKWMGKRVTTLEDLLRPALRAVCIGINPAPKSVAAGHYYQGTLGQGFFRRLRTIGLLPAGVDGWEDDMLFGLGIGFSDIVKRPTASASEVRPEEYRHGEPLLRAKLETARPGLVLFTFKNVATRMFGQFQGNGFIQGLNVASAPVFVMPGPYEGGDTASASLKTLRRALGQ